MSTTTITPATERPMPWDVMGDNLKVKDAPLRDVLAQTGLDYQVTTLPVVAYNPVPVAEGEAPAPIALADFIEAPAQQAIVRPMPDGTQKVLAVTGQRYTPIQNAAAFSVADDLREMGAQIVGAADFRGGGSSLLVMRMPAPIVVRRQDGGEDVTDLDLLIRNAHDGSAALSFSLTAMRLACTNALPAAIADAQRSWKINHTPNADVRMDLAHQALRKAVGYQERFQVVAQGMADQKMVDAEFRKIVAGLWPVAPDEEGRKAEVRRQVQDDLWALYNTSATLEGVRGTRWGGFNAITEYLDHYRPVKGKTDAAKASSRAEGALADGANVRLKAKVWERFSLAGV